MNIEQAKQNIKEHCYFANLLPQAKESLDIAIKSLDMWDKVIKELEDDEQLAFMYGSIDMYTGIKESREVIEKYKKEINE